MAIVTKTTSASAVGTTAANDIIVIPTIAGIGGTINGLGGIDEIRFDNPTASTFDLALTTALSIEAITLGSGIGATAITNSTTGLSIDASAYAGTNGMLLTGNAGDNSMEGTANADTIVGGAGADVLSGGNGNDLFIIASGASSLGDVIDGDAGIDVIRFAATAADGDLLVLDELSAVEVIVIGTGTGATAVTTGTAAHSVDASLMATALTLVGNAGSNFLASGAGNDTIQGGAGNDTLDGGGGANSLLGGLGNDLYVARSALDTFLDTGGTSDGVEAWVSGLTLGTGVEKLFMMVAGSGTGNALSNVLVAAEGATTLTGGLGNDTYNLQSDDVAVENVGEGTDKVFVALTSGQEYLLAANVDNLALVFSDDAGTATLTGNLLGNAIGGDFSADSISGGAGNDTITGLGGNDTLEGGDGKDSLAGGTGNDLYVVNLSNPTPTSLAVEDGLAEGVGEGADTLRLIGGVGVFDVGLLAYTLAANVENLDFSSTVAALRINATGNALDNSMTGNQAANKIDGGAGSDIIAGGAGSDTLLGGLGNDSIVVGSIADYANDVIDGGAGVDTVRFSPAGAQTLVLASGTRTLGIEAVAISGGMNGSVDASALSVPLKITGDASDNTLTGSKGSDTILGGAGNDTIVVKSTLFTLFDRIDGGAGNDRVLFASTLAHDTLVVRNSVGVEAFLISDADGLTTGTLALNINASGVGNAVAIYGNNGANKLTGSAFDDTLDGGGGSDFLSGGAGVDVLVGGNGGDMLSGGTGTDTATYAGATGPVVVDLDQFSATGAFGVDFLASIEKVIGSSYADSISGGTASDFLGGGAGNDTLAGRDGNDTLDGGGDVDTANYSGAAGPVGVYLFLGGAAVSGAGPEIDSLVSIENVMGSGFDDLLVGDSGQNSLAGGAGNDTLAGLGGDDTLDGGAGNDTADYSAEGAGITVSLSTLTVSGATVGTDTLVSIEKVLGTAFADSITGGAGNDSLTGGAGNDTLDGAAGNDAADYSAESAAITVNLATGTVSGASTGTDTLISMENVIMTANADSIAGSSAANVLAGGAGNDTLDGAGGNDTADYSAEGAAVVVDLTAGTASGASTGTDSLISIENATGSAFADSMAGSGGNNVLAGGAGNDTLDGAGGTFDFVDYSGESAGVTLNLTAGTASGASTGTDSLAGFENATGSAFADTLTGDAGGNNLLGGAGNDSIDGGAGNDNLLGGAGNDTLNGNSGIDQLSYTDAGAAVVVDLAAGTGGGASEGSDLLSGFEIVFGSTFNDSITGDAGVNELIGSAGNDSLDGGGGIDTVNFRFDSSGNMTIDMGEGTATDATSGSVDSFTNFENLFGGSFNDSITGNSGDNVLAGGTGNDTVDGGAGNDTLMGAADTLIGGAFGSAFTGTGNDSLVGGSGNDTVDYRGATSFTANLTTGSATGSFGSDTLSGIENVIGGAGNDSITGSSAANVLAGGAGNDTLDGVGGNDTADYSAEGAAVVVDLTAGTASGASTGTDALISIENATGSAFADSIAGSGGNNVLAGGAGNDTLDGAGGTFDFVDYSGESAGVALNLATGTAGGASTGTDSLAGFENATGSAFADTLTGDAGGNNLLGGAGNDSVDGGAGNDLIYGDAGNDTLNGNSGNDIAEYANETAAVTVNLGTGTASGASAGTDSLSGFEGIFGSNFDDTLTGDGGANEISGALGNDSMDGGGGIDTVQFRFDSSGNMTIDMGAGTATDATSGSVDSFTNFENLFGGTFNDSITGSSGDNVLAGGSGNDTVDGGAGNDTLVGGANASYSPAFGSISTGTGNDSLVGGSGTDTVDYSGSSAVTVNLTTGLATSGTFGADTLSGIENVIGGAVNDSITGSSAANVLAGGAGNDTLDGAGGNDAFHFTVLAGASNSDTITDFIGSGADELWLAQSVFSAFVATGGVASGSVEQASGVTDGSGTGANFLKFDTATSNLYYDADGSGTGGAGLLLVATLTGVSALALTGSATSDILIV